MERVDKILQHPKYIEYMQRIATDEKDRIFCRHDLQHAIDVARIAYILVLENKLIMKKDMIYATALLHDIGRWKEYEESAEHAEASAELAAEILADCGFDAEEREFMLKAIRDHRKSGTQSTFLSSIIYKSDKMSRLCIDCDARDQCKRFANGGKINLYY
ncbi:MAG: uncharacterized protein PWP55_329 [Clostridiales bacterium]|nr:uncharacterized protein [Clostridiales bacterium]